jgi:hypothetical protein
MEQVMARRSLSAAMCSAVLVFTAITAAAADPDPKIVKQAQERLVEGNRLFDKGEYEGARVAYEQSLALVPHGSTYRNLGRTEIRLGDPLTALKHLRIAVNDPELDAKRKAITQQDLNDAYAATGHLAVHTSSGAGLAIDGTTVEGTAPFASEFDVTAGKHMLEARLGGHSAKAEVEAKAGQLATIDIPIVAPAPPSTLGVSDGAASSARPVASLPEVPRQEEPRRAFWNARREIGLAVAAAGVLGLAAGGYFYADGVHQQDRASSLAGSLLGGACNGPMPPSTCGALQDARNAQGTDETLRIVFLGVGAAALLAGAALFLWPEPNHSQTAVVPLVVPQGGGLLLHGEL